MPQRMGERMSARHAGILVLARGNRALDGEDILAVVLFDRCFKMFLERLAAARAENMTVLERNAVQHEIRCKRCTRSDERLVTARALMPVQPDDNRQRFRLGSLDDLRQHLRAQSHERRERHASL